MDYAGVTEAAFQSDLRKSLNSGSVVVGVEENDRLIEILLLLSRCQETWKQ